MHDLVEKNLNNLLTSNPRLADKLDELRDLATSTDAKTAQEELTWWVEHAKHKSIVLPQWFPRQDPEVFLANRESHNYYELGKSVETYRHKNAEDPHLTQSLASLRDFLDSTDFDFRRRSTVAARPTNALVSLGTGTGSLLRDMISQLNPYRVIILVSDWSEMATSFREIDWDQLATHYHQSDLKDITFERVTDKYEMLSALMREGILSVDLAPVLSFEQSNKSLVDQFSELVNENLILNCLTYTGFTLDEYNMVLNTVETLAKQPLIYRKPTAALGGSAIVCGSGPSLDKSISIFQEISKSTTIIAGGSNYRTLRKNGIDVDMLVLNERSKETYDDYKAVIDEFGRDNCILIMSTTCPHQLTDLFDQTIVYYRPALTPISIFATSLSQHLPFEGPESVNAGSSVAVQLGFSSIFFVGIDLGTSDLSVQRSNDAAGATPRIFELKTIGNFKDEVYTTQTLVDTKVVIERLLDQANETTTVYNCSDGVKIGDCVSLLPENIKSVLDSGTNKVSLSNWIKTLISYTPSMLQTSWYSRDPRRAIFEYCDELRSIFSGNDPWFPTVLAKIDKINNLNVGIKKQIPRRLWRSTVLKVVAAITQQMNVMKGYPEELDKLEKFGSFSRQYCNQLASMIESEGYDLCDKIEEAFQAK